VENGNEDFKDLTVWQKAQSLTVAIYSATRVLPKDEIYGLTSQLRRAAVSVDANIAGGCGRRSDGEFVRFLQIARGSASEVEHHLLLARDLKFLTQQAHKELEKQWVEVEHMLTSLVNSIQRAPGCKAIKGCESGLEASG
jgi:four helix bundle protein